MRVHDRLAERANWFRSREGGGLGGGGGGSSGGGIDFGLGIDQLERWLLWQLGGRNFHLRRGLVAFPL